MLAYFSYARDLLAKVATSQTTAITHAERMLGETVAAGGIWHLFGSGHSHLAAEEMFYRAGGLAPVNAMVFPGLAPHEAPVTSTRLERLAGLGALVFERYDIREADLLTIVSNSGRNAAVVELAQAARARGVKTLAICSLAHATSTHPGAAAEVTLPHLCDHVIDNGGAPGDAALPLGDEGLRICPTSTLMNTAILQQMVFGACQYLREQGLEVPVFRSANLPGGDEWNAALIARYRERVGLW